jgi:aminobenzoyl-glutamate utilization protein B
MLLRRIFFAFTLITTLATTAFAQKDQLVKSVDARADESWQLAKKIWEWAEPGYQETRSAAALADYLETAGFTVKRGVAKIPTAFTATFGEERPIIGILGEYDALPELSQAAVPFRDPLPTGNGYGHACGHHLFGVASASASIAIAEQIKAGTITGTVRFYGCPAEEGGAAKVFMAREGLFDDLDIALHWHPGSRNAAGDQSCLARVAVKFRFHGTAAHAAGSPEKGRSALDALLLTIHAVELLREHTPDGTRLHHVITSGGAAPNVVPEFAEGFFYVRHPKADVVQTLYPRLKKCAEAGAHATETRLEIVHLGGTRELLPNDTLARLAKANLIALNDLSYDDEEMKFAMRMQDMLPDKVPLDDIKRVQDVSGTVGMGSTDVGDVSWVVPTTGFRTACWVPGTPGHSWQAVACGGTTIGKKGMQLAAKVLAATAWDLYTDPQRVAAAKAEFTRRLAGRKYEPMLEKNQPPPLDYRNPPRRGVAAGER